MSAVLAVVVPVFGTVAIGYGLARVGLFRATVGEALVRFMYYLAIPAMLFESLSSANLPAAVPWQLLAAYYVPSFAMFALGVLVGRRLLGWPRSAGGMAGMSASYSNMVLLGFPLTLAAFGEAGSVPTFILLATQSLLMFPLTTWALEMHDGGRSPAGLARAALRLALNPVILSLVLGVLANLAGLVLHPTLDRTLSLLSAAGPGCALVALGVSLAQYRVRGGTRDVVVLVALKNFVHPAAVWVIGAALGLEAAWLAVAVLLAAMPTGINAFIFAGQYGVRQETVSKTIVLSTALSAVTVSALLALLL